jgi:hypothetical protein
MADGQKEIQGRGTPKDNVIDFTAARERLPETRQDQHMHRRLQPPQPRTDREKRQEAKRRQSIREALAHEEGQQPETQDNPIDLGVVQECIDRKWEHDFLKETYYSPNLQITDAEWARYQRIDPSGHDRLKDNIRLENRIREIKEQAGGDENVFEALWQKELEALRAEERKKRTEQQVKQPKMPGKEDTREQIDQRIARFGFRPLTDEQWQEWERIREVDPASLTREARDERRRNPASLTEQDIKDLEEYEKALEEHRQGWRKRDKWHEIAYQNGWLFNPDDPNDGYYVYRIVENAEELGLDPLTLSPQERRDLTHYGATIIDTARRLGLDPRTLTPQQREDLQTWDHLPTDEERKKRAEMHAKYTRKPFTQEEWNNLFRARWEAEEVNAKATFLPELLQEFAPNIKEKGFMAALKELILDFIQYTSQALSKTAKHTGKDSRKLTADKPASASNEKPSEQE